MQLIGLKLSAMIVVFKSLSACKKEGPEGNHGLGATVGSRFLGYSSRKFTEIHEKTGGQWH